MNNSSLNICAEFYLDRTTQAIRIFDKTNYNSEGIDLSNVVGIVKITDPNNNIIYNNEVNYTSPDIDLDVSRASGYIDLPTDDNSGEVIKGEYEVKYWIQLNTGVEYRNVFTFDYSYTRPSIGVTTVLNGYSSTYKITDNTNYDANGNINNSYTGYFSSLNEATPYKGTISVNNHPFIAGDVIIINNVTCYVESKTTHTFNVFSPVNLYTNFTEGSGNTHTVRHYTHRTTFSVTPPAGSGMSVLSNTDTDSQEYSPNIYSGSYDWEIETQLAKKHASNIYIFETVSDSDSDHAYKIDEANLLDACEDLYSDYESALSTNIRRANTLKNSVNQIGILWDNYSIALKNGDNLSAYNAATSITSVLNDYIDTTSDPQEIIPFVNNTLTGSDEKVKINSTATTAKYLIDNLYNTHFEIINEEIRIKNDALADVKDYVSKSSGGSFDDIIKYSVHPAGLSANEDIPDIKWITDQAYISLTDLSVSGPLLTYNNSTGEFSLEDDLNEYDNSITGFISGNETIALTGDITGTGETSITCTLANNAIKSNHLSTDIISTLSELTEYSESDSINILGDGDEFMVSSQGALRKVGMDTLAEYVSNNTSINHSELNNILGSGEYHLDATAYIRTNQKATDSKDGYLSKEDWYTFNNKADDIIAGSGIDITSGIISVLLDDLIDDTITSTSLLWSSANIDEKISDAITAVVANTLSYIDGIQDPDDPTALDPGAPSGSTENKRYIITDADNLHTNFENIDKDSDGNATTLQDNDVVQCIDIGESGSSSVSANDYEYRIIFNASNQTSTADAIVGLDYNGNTGRRWLFNLTTWVDRGSALNHNVDLLNVLPVGNDRHMSVIQLNSTTDQNGSVDNADSQHNHSYGKSFILKNSERDGDYYFNCAHGYSSYGLGFTLWDHEGYYVPITGDMIERINTNTIKITFPGELPGNYEFIIGKAF